MKIATAAKILATGLALLMMVVEVAANDPIFVKWLVIDDPGDETIRIYWERAEAGELGAGELVDLGTMLFYRGWPSDAVDYIEQALDIDPDLADGWFRIGLIKHHDGDISGARSAYEKCLKIQSGHAWGNFYLGLLEEQTGNGKKAIKHYEKAFQHAPELANPKVNPEILSSRLQLGAQVQHFGSERFERMAPMPFLEPATMRKVRRQVTKTSVPVPEPTPVPTIGPGVSPTPTPAPVGNEGANKERRAKTRKATVGAAAAGAGAATAGGETGGRTSGRSRSGGSGSPLPDPGSTPYGIPTPPPGTTGTTAGAAGAGSIREIGETSPEARLLPIWPGLHELAEILI